MSYVFCPHSFFFFLPFSFFKKEKGKEKGNRDVFPEETAEVNGSSTPIKFKTEQAESRSL